MEKYKYKKYKALYKNLKGGNDDYEHIISEKFNETINYRPVRTVYNLDQFINYNDDGNYYGQLDFFQMSKDKNTYNLFTNDCKFRENLIELYKSYLENVNKKHDKDDKIWKLITDIFKTQTIDSVEFKKLDTINKLHSKKDKHIIKIYLYCLTLIGSLEHIYIDYTHDIKKSKDIQHIKHKYRDQIKAHFGNNLSPKILEDFITEINDIRKTIKEDIKDTMVL